MKKNNWEIHKKDDGTFAIFQNRELLHDSVPDKWLEAELGRYGFLRSGVHRDPAPTGIVREAEVAL
jgi:hypothetical protein